MPAIVVPNGALGVISGTNLGQPWANVIGLRMPDNTLIDQSVADDVASRIRSAYASINGSLSTNWTMNAFVLQDLRTSSSPSWDAAFSAVVGIAGDNAMPSNFAITASHRTGLRGKSFNGRTYLCGWTEAANDATGKIATGYRTQVETMFDDMRTNLALVAGGAWEHAVVSRTLLVATPVTTSVVDQHWDHQDRRKT